MTHASFPLWVYAGIFWAGINAACLGYFSAQQIDLSPTPTSPHPTDLRTVLETQGIAFTASGNTTVFVTEEVPALFQLLQKNRIRITQCQISAQAQQYHIRLETQP